MTKKFFSDRKRFLTKIIILLAKKNFDSKFFDPKFFLTQNIGFAKEFFDQKLFWTNFFDQHFWTTFSTTKRVKPQIRYVLTQMKLT